MARFKSNYVEPVSETGNWNVAFDYTKLKISKLLVELDEFQLISMFGTSELVEEFMINEDMKNMARLKSLERMLKTLMMVIENTKFAIKKKEDKKLISTYYQRLKNVEEVFPTIKREITKNEKKIIEIDETNFKIVLDILIDIKCSLNTPLNNADLIFNSREEFDPDKFKRDVMNKMSTRA